MTAASGAPQVTPSTSPHKILGTSPSFRGVEVASRRGGPALEKSLELLQVHRLPGGQAVHRHPDGRSVGLAEDRHVDVLTEVRGHELPLPTV